MKAPASFRFYSLVGCCFVGLLLSVHTGFSQTPTTSNGWFQLFQAKNDLTWSGSDQATSYRANNGKVYWLFGDTILGTRNPATGGYNPGWYMVANTVLLESNGVLSGATSTAPAVPNAGNGDRYWPQGVFEANGYLYCLCSRVRNTNTGLGFIPLGSELAKFDFQPNGQLTFLGMISTPGTGIAEGIGASAIQWTRDAAVYDNSVYIFGDALTGVPLSPKAGYVSRVAVADIENTNSWTFWNGSLWVANMANSAPIIADMPSSVRLLGGKWVILYKPFAGWGDQVKAAIGSAPQGPYTSGQVIFQSPGGTTSNGVTTNLHCYQTYSPQSHPEYPPSSGKLLVSIAWNGCDLFNDTANDARLYKPRFYEIALTGITVTLPASATEGDGVLMGQGCVTPMLAPTNNLVVALSSSDTTEVTVPATVTILAGQTNATFDVTIVDDAELDGTKTATISATAPGCSDTRSISVNDNETATLGVILPAAAIEGVGTVPGQVTVSAPVGSSVTVNLSSSDTSELTVPATVTIPTGQTNAGFTATVVNDTATDGTQIALVTAHVANWTDGTAAVSILDNDPHHFAWGAISSPQSAGTPFSVTIMAQDINSATLSNYPGPANLSGFGDGGAVALTPSGSGAFSNGLWAGNLTVNTTPDTNVRLVASDGAGHSGTSTVFSVLGLFTLWQLNYFGCTNCSQAAATSDPDGDGQDNLTEFLTGMDPTNSTSYWRIQASPTNGLAPLLVNFTNNATGSSITNLVWSFGDGGVGSGANPSHTYTNAGTFSVGLTLFNLNGTATLVASNLITVLPAATVEVAALALLDRWGDLMPASGVAVLVVDTATNGFVDPQPPFPLSVGAAWGTDDRVVGLWNLNSCGDGCLWDQTAVGYTNGITAGQTLRLYWFPSLTLASNTVGWTYYGKYTDTNSPPLDGSAPWELPPLESSATLIFFTQSEGGSNPNDAGRATWSTFLDSDADDIPDYWMLQYFGHATGQASDHSRAMDDADGTGQNNLFKYTAGLDPTNPASVFVLKAAAVPSQSGQMVLTWKPWATGRTYAPEYRTNLVFGSYEPLTGYDGPQTNSTEVSITDLNATEASKFYRIKISYP